MKAKEFHKLMKRIGAVDHISATMYGPRGFYEIHLTDGTKVVFSCLIGSISVKTVKTSTVKSINGAFYNEYGPISIKDIWDLLPTNAKTLLSYHLLDFY